MTAMTRVRESRLSSARPRHLGWLLMIVLAAAIALTLPRYYFIGVNASSSLPHTVYLINRQAPLERGHYVAFRWGGGGPYREGTIFIKVLGGLPGDTVRRDGAAFFVNDHAVGLAKPLARNGEPLAPGPTGPIPPGQYYVMAPHTDSLDSRYRLTGWIPQHRIIGRAYALF